MKHFNLLSRRDVKTTLAMIVGSPSAHRLGTMLKHLAFLLLFLFVGIGNVWGADQTVTWTINGVNKATSSGGQNVNTTLKTSSKSPTSETGVWTAVASSSYASSNSGAQFGSGSYTFAGTITLSGTSIPSTATIKSVTLRCTTNGTAYKVNASVSNNTFGSQVTLNSSSAKDYTFTGSQVLGTGGNIVLTFSSGGKKNFVVKSLSVTYEEAPSYTINAQSNNTSKGTVSLSGTTITATPKSGYRVSTSIPYTISPANSATVSQNGNTFSVTASANTTITINFEAIPTYTVTWVAGSNSSFGSQTDYAGTALTDPGEPSASNYCPGGKVFVGWTATPIDGEGNAPADLFTSVSGKSIPVNGTTYYAVFATASGGGSSNGSNTLVSKSTSTYYSTGYITGVLNTDATWTTDAFTMVQHKISGNTAVSLSYDEIRVYANHSLTFTPSSGTTITSIVVTAGSDAYATALGGSSISNCTKSVSSSTVTITPTDGTSAITIVNSAQSRLNSIVVNYTTGGGTTYSNYATTCCQTLGAPTNVAVSVTGTQAATVSWDDVENASGYEYTLDEGAHWTVATSPLNLTSSQGLAAATQYSIQVRATGTGDYCAEGAAADAVNFKTWATVTAATNDALKGTAQVSKDNENWASSVDAADGTTIYVKATPVSASFAFNDWSTSSGSLAAQSATTTLGSWSGNTTVTATFISAELPTLATPTGMASNSVTAISAVVSWTAVDHASGYTVTCVKTSDGSTTGIVIGDVDGTSCTISGLIANTGYTWNVLAVGDNENYKNGSACADQTFTTDLKKPATVEITTAPTKTVYNSGETFVPTGMVVKVTYNNGDIDAAYTGYTISKETALSPSDTYVTITATLNEVSASVNQEITVNAKLTWKAAGAEDVITYASSGKVVMPTGDNPTAPSCLGDFDTFQGWSASAIAVSTTTTPTYVSAETDAAADATFYAVFAKMGEGDEEDANSVFTVKTSSTPSSPYNATDGSTWTYNTSEGLNFENGANAGFVKSKSGWIQVVLPESATEAVSYVVTKTSNSWSGDAAASLTSGSTNVATINNASNRSYTFTNSDKDLGTYRLTNLSSTGKACFIDYITINYKKVGQAPVEWATTCCSPWDAPEISYSVPSGWKKNDAAVEVEIAEGDVYGAVTYESSNTDVLTVAADGSITAVAPGTATVTATWAGATVESVKYCEASSTSAEIEVSGTVTVKFDGSGATSGTMSDQEITYKTATNLTSNAFSKTGYSFGGWAESAEAATAKTVLYTNGQEVTLTAGCTLYAIWNINSHAVTLTQPTGNTIEATGAANLASVAYGTDITLTATENDGYVFTGWDATGVVLANTNPVAFAMPDNDVTVSATYSTYTWENATPRYSVTTAPKIVYNKVETFSTAGVVIKENFMRSDDNTITKQETYSDAWTAKLNGVAIEDGAALSLEDNDKTLKLYIGELEIASYTLTVNDVIADQFIDGLWGNATQIITDDNYTVPSLSNQTLGDAATCKDHNIFIGWVLAANADEPTDDNKVVAGNAASKSDVSRTYYAIWAKHFSGSKTFETSKSSFSGSDNNGASLNSDVSYSTATNGGSTAPGFTGTKLRLYQIKSGQSYGNSITISGGTGVTLNKVELETSGSAYSYVASTYTTSGLTSGTVTDDKIVLDELSSQHMTIINMSTSNSYRLDISKITVTYSKNVEEDIDYITDCTPRHDVTFDANGGTGSYDALSKKTGVNFALPDGSVLSKDHHTFIGWRDNNAGTGTLYTTTYTMPDEDVTLYAQWDEDHHAFVHFMDGENEVAGSPIKVYDGGTFDLLAAPDAPANKLFVSWKWNNTSYTAGQQNQHMSDPAEDRTYTAVWITKQTEPEANVDLSNGKWILVTNENQLKAGDFIVIAAANSAKALSTNQKSSNRGAVDVTKTNDTLSFTITENAANVAPLFLQRDAETGFYALYDRAYDSDEDNVVDASGYLYANGGSNSNTLKTQENITMQGLWSISVANKQASIVAQGNNSNRIMRYNSGSNLFTCYGSETQQPIAIYKWYKTLEAGTTNVADIEWTDAVIVPNGATLNVPADATLDNVIVEAGGKVMVADNKTLSVNDITIQSKAGASGQLIKGTGSSATVTGDIYMDVKFYTPATLDETSANQWYMISAPFAVNLNGGFLQTDGTPMVFGTDFDLFEYDGSKRAETGVTGWKRVQGQMPAGTACLIGFNEGQSTTIRLKAASKTISDPTSITLGTFAGDDANKNWNGVANPRMRYTSVDKDVMIYNNDEGENGRKYITYGADEYSFVVGTPFFVQATGEIDLKGSLNGSLRAPKREDKRYSYRVQITREGATEFADQMYVRASEEATNTYEQGHDMIAWNGTSGKSALLWAENYGMRLAIEEAPLVNNTASYVLGIYAPKAGVYTISIPSVREDASLYLTKDGAIIWDLTMSPFEAELSQGQNSGYGLLLQARAPQIATGVEDVQGDKVQCTKVVINDNVFILRGEQLYDVTGKMVK